MIYFNDIKCFKYFGDVFVSICFSQSIQALADLKLHSIIYAINIADLVRQLGTTISVVLIKFEPIQASFLLFLHWSIFILSDISKSTLTFPFFMFVRNRFKSLPKCVLTQLVVLPSNFRYFI